MYLWFVSEGHQCASDERLPELCEVYFAQGGRKVVHGDDCEVDVPQLETGQPQTRRRKEKGGREGKRNDKQEKEKPIRLMKFMWRVANNFSTNTQLLKY